MIPESERHERGMKSADPDGSISGMRQRRNSLILIASLAAALVVLYIFQKKTVSEPGLRCVIQIDGEQVHTMELDRDGEYRAEDPEGHYNIVKVRDGAVLVTEADCLGQVCVRTGEIRNPGEVIACLPHRMIISIVSGTEP